MNWNFEFKYNLKIDEIVVALVWIDLKCEP